MEQAFGLATLQEPLRQVRLLEASSPTVMCGEATLHRQSVHLGTLLWWWAIEYVAFCESSIPFFCEVRF